MIKKLAKIKYLPNNFQIIEAWRICYMFDIWQTNKYRKFELLEC